MVAEYPGSPYTANPQSTASDDAGNDVIANGADYNKHDGEIAAISADLIAAFTAAGASTVAAAMTAIVGGYTDGSAWFGTLQFVDREDSGQWTRIVDGPVIPVFRHTPGTAADALSCDLALISRGAAGRGTKITSIEFVYEITVAAASVDVAMAPILVELNGNGTNPSFSVPSGTFDSNHDTPTKRAAIGEHTAVFTLDTPVFLSASAGMNLIFEPDDAVGSSACDFWGCKVNFEQVFVDGS